jgi:hypothetical protein
MGDLFDQAMGAQALDQIRGPTRGKVI